MGNGAAFAESVLPIASRPTVTSGSGDLDRLLNAMPALQHPVGRGPVSSGSATPDVRLQADTARLAVTGEHQQDSTSPAGAGDAYASRLGPVLPEPPGIEKVRGSLCPCTPASNQAWIECYGTEFLLFSVRVVSRSMLYASAGVLR